MERNFGLIQQEDRSGCSAGVRIQHPRRIVGPVPRAQVLRAAATQFATTGLRATSTPMLARAAGISERVLDFYFGSKECLFRETVEDNMKTRLRLLEARTASSGYESETAAVQRIAEATVTVCVAGPGNSRLMHWALLEDPEYAADLYRHELGSVEIVWNREFAQRFPDSLSCRTLSVNLVPYAVHACLAYGFWLATLGHDAKSAAALAQGFSAGIAQAASALLSQPGNGTRH